MKRFLAIAAFAVLPLQLSAQTTSPPPPVIETQEDWIAAIPRGAAATILPGEMRADGPWGELRFSVRFTINRDGTLQQARMIKGSGNQKADNAIMNSIRNRTYPAFTPDMEMEDLTFELPIVIVNPKPAPEPATAPFALPEG